MCWCPGRGRLGAGSQAAGGCWCLAVVGEAAARGGWAWWLAKAPLLALLAISQAAINAADSSEKRG